MLDLFKVDTFSRQIQGPLLTKVEAIDAIETHGVNAAGNPALVGNSVPSVALERAMSQWSGMAE